MSLAYLSKVSALTVLAVSIAACSSGGSHTKISPNTPPLTDQSAAAQKIEANRLVLLDKAKKAGLSDKQATAYAEANKEADATVAQAALEALVAEKVAAEKAEKERLQKIEANRLVLLDKAKKAGLSDKQATAYAEANKEANATVAQAALEALVAEKAAADKAAAEKAAAEKAEKERLQKIEANRLVLLDKAKKAGLNDEQATAYAEANKEANATAAQNALETIIAENERMALDEALYQAKGEYHNNPVYALGEVTPIGGGTSSSCINNYCSKFSSHSLVYNQPYSVVIGEYTSKQDGYSFSESSNISVQGLKTEELAIPTLGKATYSGKAFTRDGNYLQTGGLGYQGTLSYDVNFENRTGAGSITGLGDTVELQQGTISGTGISAIAQQGYKNGNYLLDFYGKKAEEIAGKVIFDGKDTIGFGGTRGEISKK